MSKVNEYKVRLLNKFGTPHNLSEVVAKDEAEATVKGVDWAREAFSYDRSDTWTVESVAFAREHWG